MPRYHQLKTNFVAGELDPLLLSRSDMKHYYNAGERCRNVIVIPQGGAEIRPGSRYIFTVPDIPAPDGGGQSNVRLAEFQFNTEQTYLVVFHHKLITIFRDELQVAQIASPWESDDLIASETATGDMVSSGIYWTQSKDTLLIFHQDYPTKKLVRGGTHSSWTLSDYTFKNIPRYDFGLTYTASDEIGVDEVQRIEFPSPGSQGDWTDGDTFVLIVEDEESDNIPFASSDATMRNSIEAALREMDNTSATGISVVSTSPGSGLTIHAAFDVTFSGDDGERPWGSMFYRTVSSEQIPSIDIIVTTKGQLPGEEVWSTVRGYPRCGTFFQGRLWMAGTIDLPHYVWASRIGGVDDFNSKLFRDDYGIAVPADTDDVPAFTAIKASRHLQFFSRSGEFYVPSSERDAITPGNMALRRNSSRGCKPGLRVFEIDGATHFIQRRGRALREFIFTDVEQAYQTNNISLLSPHLMRDPVDFALRRSTSTTDADYEFMPNADGTMSVFCTLRTQEVNAMTLWVTEGSYLAVTPVLDDVYFGVRRTIDGNSKTFIEIMDDDLTVDCGLTGTGVATAATLAHLPNTTIENLLDEVIQAPVTSNGSGVATFYRPTVTDWAAGLKFAEPDADYPGLIWVIKSLPIALDLPEGSILGKKRRIVNISIRLHETSALTVNSNVQSFRQFGEALLDKKITPFTGVKPIRGLLGWDYDGSVVLGSDQSLKASILALSFSVSV